MFGINELIISYKSTILLYFLVIVIASCFAALSYYKGSDGYYKWKWYWLFLSFLVLLFFLGFADCGADYYSYKRIFDHSFDWHYQHTDRIERGYLLINAIVKSVVDNYKVFHFIWALIMLTLVYSTIAKYRDIVKPGWSVLAYSSIFMIQSLDLMRMYLAVAIIFWGIRFFLQNKRIHYLIVILIAFFIHRSAICMLVPYVMWIMFSKGEKYFLKSVVTLIMYLAFYFSKDYLFQDAVLGYQYSGSTDGALGITQILYALPIFALILFFRYYKNDFENDNIVGGLSIFYFSSLIFSMMSYSITPMGRVLFYFTYPYILLPGYFLTNHRYAGANVPINILNIYKLIGFLLILYYLFRAYMMISYIELDGLEIYTNVFGFST